MNHRAPAGVTGQNVNHVLSDALWLLSVRGVRAQSRNGPTIYIPAPTILTYVNPMERVLFNEKRNANPFFHLMESLWMMNGANDLEFVRFFVKRMEQFSDDGQTLNGAYGKRWRTYYKHDQLHAVIKLLKEKPDTRRAVVAMWDGSRDAMNWSWSKDVPCNTHVYFALNPEGDLDMTVCNRSNDLIWGACGANAVHMSVLQEYVACGVGVPVGTYYQMTNNLHIYLETFGDNLDQLKLDFAPDDRYDTLPTYSTFNTPLPAWEADLGRFMKHPLASPSYDDPFFNGVAAPMFASWYDRKLGTGTGIEAAMAIGAQDWQTACVEWIHRHDQAKERKEA